MSRKASGFTLIEMLIVVAIIAVLAGVGYNYYVDSIEDARTATVRTNIKVVREAISRYFKDHMAYPTSLESLQGPYLQQPMAELLLNPLLGNGIIMVEVADPAKYNVTYNAFQATETVRIEYSTHDGRQIKGIRIKYHGTEMNW